MPKTDTNRTEEAQEVFRQKRVPKTPIKFKHSLNEEQKDAKAIVLDSEITVITGPAAAGKTYLTANICLDLLFKKEVDKVYITRPTKQVGDSLGFLPGDLDDKLNPYLDPFKDNLYECYDRNKVDALIKDSAIEGTAIQFIRGKTIRQNEILIVDESQNLSTVEIIAILTRLGKGGKIIILGDPAQKDTKESMDGLSYAIEMAKNIEGIELVKLHSNHRSGLVSKILAYHYGRD